MRCFQSILSTEASLGRGADAATQQRRWSRCHDDGHSGNGCVFVQRQADDREGVPETPERLRRKLLWEWSMTFVLVYVAEGLWRARRRELTWFELFVLLFARRICKVPEIKPAWMFSQSVRICHILHTYCLSVLLKFTAYCIICLVW